MARGELPGRHSGLLIVLLALTVACSGVADEAADGDPIDVAEQQAQLAASLGIDDPPEVDVARIVTPEERGDLVASCLAEQG